MVKNPGISNTSYLVWPSIIAFLFFISSLWIYSNHADLIFLAGILYALIIGVVGIISLIKRRFKKSLSYIAPSIVFLILASPAFLPVRLNIVNVRHYVQFMLNKSAYETEVERMKARGILYGRWNWGKSNGVEYNLIYDESDRIALTGSVPTQVDPCSRDVLSLGSHFYVTADFCP